MYIYIINIYMHTDICTYIYIYIIIIMPLVGSAEALASGKLLSNASSHSQPRGGILHAFLPAIGWFA